MARAYIFKPIAVFTREILLADRNMGEGSI